MDQQKIAKAVKDLLIAIGEDPEREGLAETPQRVAKMYQEVFSSLNHQPEEMANYKVFHVDDVPEMVLVQHIPFYSMCEHHLLPFFGSVHVAYYPKNGTIAGFGHFVRAVDILARRPQLQERMTDDLCQSICRGLNPEGVLIIVKATHLCLTMRDRMAIDSNIVTTASSGCLKEGTAAYDQAWKLLMEEKKDG